MPLPQDSALQLETANRHIEAALTALCNARRLLDSTLRFIQAEETITERRQEALTRAINGIVAAKILIIAASRD
jgi:hypothetical protein